jgi:hypothetical protein
VTAAAQGTGRFLLGDSPAELQHLVAQAEGCAPEARELLGRIGLPPGAHAMLRPPR